MFLYPRSMHCISSTCKGSFYVTSLFRNLNLVCTLASNLQKHEHKFNDFESFEWRHEHLRYTHTQSALLKNTLYLHPEMFGTTKDCYFGSYTLLSVLDPEGGTGGSCPPPKLPTNLIFTLIFLTKFC